MSAEHTPGPWRVGAIDMSSVLVDWRDEDDCLRQDALHKNGYGKVVASTGRLTWRTIGQQVADARLIAAAPELYGQLQSGQTDLDLLRRAIEENDPKAELLIRVTDLWKRNDAALAKVRGEQA